ncbi:OmpA family protein [Flavitalea flava]
MSSALIDSVKSVFTDILITKFSLLLGEPEGNVQKAIHGAIPMILNDVLYKAYFPEGATKVADLARQATGSDFFGQLHELSISTGGLMTGSLLLNKGTDFARALLTPRTDAVIQEIGRYSGISIPSASFITAIASFASLDAIGRHLTHSNVDSGGLALWLKSQSDSIVHAVPAALQVKTALGIHHYPWEKAEGVRKNSLLYILGTILLLAVLFFFIYRSCGNTEVTAPVSPADTVVSNPAPANPAPATAGRDTVVSPTIKVTLPNGKVLDAYQGGTEDRLVNFLKDPTAKLDKKKGNWFDFSQIGFASNSSSLLLESDRQLKNIVAILDAFPKAKIKIGGYSDNTGDSTANLRLSRERADNILAKLKEFGAKAAQLTGAEGYGPKFPVGDNGTASGRALNRRMSINVKAK